MRKPIWVLYHATEGVGRTYPQHQTMGPGYDYDARNSVHKLPDRALPRFKPNFETVTIHGHARLTDLLSSAPLRPGFLVSGRLRALLERFDLPLHRFYPVPMVHRNEPVSDYFWLELPLLELPTVEGATRDEADATIVSAAERAEFDLSRVGREYRPTPDERSYIQKCFISDPLRRAWEEAGITGARLWRF